MQREVANPSRLKDQLWLTSLESQCFMEGHCFSCLLVYCNHSLNYHQQEIELKDLDEQRFTLYYPSFALNLLLQTVHFNFHHLCWKIKFVRVLILSANPIFIFSYQRFVREELFVLLSMHSFEIVRQLKVDKQPQVVIYLWLTNIALL